jgi:hypothetical protein
MTAETNLCFSSLLPDRRETSFKSNKKNPSGIKLRIFFRQTVKDKQKLQQQTTEN